MKIEAQNKPYRALNEEIHRAVKAGETDIELNSVCGQRYIGAGLNGGTRITIRGVPGNDMAVFMDGTELIVRGNAQDAVGNTMNAGRVVIHGNAGDVLGYSMRGGELFVKGNVGYRAGIHMKAYENRSPSIVIGGQAGDYLGEYMAGGTLVVLGLGDNSESNPHYWEGAVGEHVGTGMHGGVIYVRGKIEPWQIAVEVGSEPVDEEDWESLQMKIKRFSQEFEMGDLQFAPDEFVKLQPVTTRPYGRLYAY
ncbi:MAG: hypothetical protein KGZ25_04820 [Planctomycetes bacterium]|nr:hypothetical protein [Planctomycetota bacterium]